MTPVTISINEANFPSNPDPSQLRNTYVRLREAAITLNRSRGQYVGQVRRLSNQIISLEADFQAEITELRNFAESAGVDLQQSAELNRVIQGYAQVVSDLQTAADEVQDAFEIYEGRAFTGINSIPNLINAIKRFVKTWLNVKLFSKENNEIIGEINSSNKGGLQQGDVDS